MNALHSFVSYPRIRVRRDGGPPARPRRVVYWMQRSQRERDPWPPERPVLGFIRPMTTSGAARKFDVDAYIASVAIAGAREGVQA